MRFVLGYGLNDIDHTQAVAIAAEQAGFDTFTIGDSLFYPKVTESEYPYKTGDRSFLENQPFIEPIVMFSALAAVTKTLRFYPGVLKLPSRHPIITAKLYTSLAYISNNRVALGVGISPWKEDLTYLGVEWDRRGRLMDECIMAVRGVMAGGYFGFDGEFYKFGEVKMNPIPSKPVPIIVGGHSEPALKRAARLGDGWMSATPNTEEMLELTGKLLRYRRQFGTEGRPFEIHGGPTDPFDLVAIRRLVDAGVTDIFAAPWNIYAGQLSLKAKLDAVKRYGDEVIGKLRS